MKLKLGIASTAKKPSAQRVGLGKLHGTTFEMRKPVKPEADPFRNIDYKDDHDVEKTQKQEVTALQQAFRDRAAREKTRFERATDSEFWFAVCFKTREQKEHFLTQLDVKDLGDKYLDGEAVAKRLGLKQLLGG